jgi:hypothetical protein
MDNPLPIQIAFGWSRDESSGISNAIRYMTRPGLSPFGPWALWSHMFLVFRFADGGQVIHEALMSEGWQAKDGKKILDWKKADPRKHVFAIRWLPIDTPDIEQIYARSCSWVGTKSYAMRQLAAFGAEETIIGRLLNITITSADDEVFCSEGASQLVGEICPLWDLRRAPDQPWDSISPQAAYEEWVRMARGLAIAQSIGDDIMPPVGVGV